MSFDRWAEEVRSALEMYGVKSDEFDGVVQRVWSESENRVLVLWRRACSCCDDENPTLVLEEFGTDREAYFAAQWQEMKPIRSISLGDWNNLAGEGSA